MKKAISKEKKDTLKLLHFRGILCIDSEDKWLFVKRSQAKLVSKMIRGTEYADYEIIMCNNYLDDEIRSVVAAWNGIRYNKVRELHKPLKNC